MTLLPQQRGTRNSNSGSTRRAIRIGCGALWLGVLLLSFACGVAEQAAVITPPPSVAVETSATPRGRRTTDWRRGASQAKEEYLPHAPGRYFDARTFQEDELAGHHEHAAVELLQIPVFVLRDEDVFKTTGDRARAVVRALEEAAHSGDRHFVVGDADGLPAIYSVSHHGGFPALVLRVTREDAGAYARRSQRAVDSRVLAEWWVAVLKDVFGVVFLDAPPNRTVAAAASDALVILRERLWNAETPGPVSAERVRSALASLPRSTRERLQALAFRVPADFVARAGNQTSAESDAN